MTRMRLRLTIGAAALAAAAFLGGRATGPGLAEAQQQPPQKAFTPTPLDRPHEVLAILDVPGTPKELRISGAVTWDVISTNQPPFIRVSNQAGKIWHLPLSRVVWIEATPIGSAIERK